MSLNKLSIDNYEIGNQNNFDLLSFYNLLPEKTDEEEMSIDFQLECEEYHHSLFYPILHYCINTLNSLNLKQLEKIKTKIGFYGEDQKIYVTVNRQMYELFFTEEEGLIDNQKINFNYGKDKFNPRIFSSHINNDNVENYKQYFDISKNITNSSIKEMIGEKATEFNLSISELIQNKKKTIVSRFLKGYSHQEGVLKSFEAEIEGKFTNLPNLLFKRRNVRGSTIEELDQIYLLNLGEKTKLIEGFDYFYYYDSHNEEDDNDDNIRKHGKRFELEDKKVYFIVIKKSLAGLRKAYDAIKQNKEANNANTADSINLINKDNTNTLNTNITNEINDINTINDANSINTNSISATNTTLKRENLTDIGNAILTSNIFAQLINSIILKKEKITINLLYIVDDEFNLDMTNIFKECLKHDKVAMNKNYHFRIYLIYTQPDLALKHFIETNCKKNNTIKELTEKIARIELEVKELKKYKTKFEEVEYETIFCKISDEVLDFCKSIKNTKNKFITIGSKDFISENHECAFTSLNNLRFFPIGSLEKNNYLIDLKTFNRVKFENINDNIQFNNIIDNYNYYIKQINTFNDVYLLADFIFMMNFGKIIGEKKLKYIFNIYMFEGYYFMVHLKKEEVLLYEDITIYKNKCKNEMLVNEKEKINLEELEEFISNYFKLLKTKDFFSSENEPRINISHLFDFKGRINYILNLYKNQDDNQNNNAINNNEIVNYAEIISTKRIFNIADDILSHESIEGLNFKNIILIRKTEFGERFNKERLKLIIKYLFNINDINIVDNLGEETNEIRLNQDRYINKDLLTIFRKEKNMLPILIKSNNEINQSIIPLIEYSYLLSVPLLLNKKDYKPNVLILANDFGILNYYYHKLYYNKFNIKMFAEKKEIIMDEQEFFKINNNDIEISNFQNVLNEKKKKNIIEKLDIILIEYFDKKNKNDEIIPDYEILKDWRDVLNNDGILAFNLRAESFKSFNNTIEKLKKKYIKVIVINLRPCSSIVFCCGNKDIKMVNYYEMTDSILQEWLNEFIEPHLVKK